jgi:hypothetical protein
MGKISRKLSGALKKAMGVGSSRCHGSSSPHFSTKQYESLMHEDKETTPTESQDQEQPMEVEDDAPYLNLEGDWETQAYALIRDHEFVHTVGGP